MGWVDSLDTQELIDICADQGKRSSLALKIKGAIIDLHSFLLKISQPPPVCGQYSCESGNLAFGEETPSKTLIGELRQVLRIHQVFQLGLESQQPCCLTPINAR